MQSNLGYIYMEQYNEEHLLQQLSLELASNTPHFLKLYLLARLDLRESGTIG